MGQSPRSSERTIDPAHLAAADRFRPAGGAVVEMHCHSSNRSLDSGVRADLIAEQATYRGLDAVCMTEHNSLWPADELRELGDRHGMLMLPAMELGTDAGHVLVFGLSRYVPELLTLTRLREVVEAEGAAMVLAHPMRPFHGNRPPWDEFPRYFDGIEVVNGDHSDTVDGYVMRQAADLGLATVAGSDAHSRVAVGRVATAFAEPVRSIEDVVRQIRARQVAPIDFRPRGGAPPAT